jgi:apolipoprotein D and lipocalin family protein
VLSFFSPPIRIEPNMPRPFQLATLTLMLLTSAIPQAPAQSATPIPKLNPKQLIGTYYVVARFPIKRQKACVANELVLYALGDKMNSVKIVTTCQIKQDNTDSWDSAGKFDKSGDGRIGIRNYIFFTKPYWIIGMAADATWAIVGTPNHKSLWLLSGTPTLPATTLAQLKSTAAAQGYNTAKLITIPQLTPLPAISGAIAPAAK